MSAAVFAPGSRWAGRDTRTREETAHPESAAGKSRKIQPRRERTTARNQWPVLSTQLPVLRSQQLFLIHGFGKDTASAVPPGAPASSLAEPAWRANHCLALFAETERCGTADCCPCLHHHLRSHASAYWPPDYLALTAANFSAQRIRPVICITTNSVMIEPMVIASPVNPLKKKA